LQGEQDIFLESYIGTAKEKYCSSTKQMA